MANQAYLKLGDIKGSCVIKAPDRQHHIPLVGFEHQLVSDLDPQTGPKPEIRRHRPIKVIKNIDFNTPRLHRALAEAELFPSARINFFHMPRSGDEKNYFSIVLTKVYINAIKSTMPSIADPNNAMIHEYEEVELAYESIAWLHTAPTGNTLEQGGYDASEFKDVLATFGPDWIEEQAKAATMATLRAATDQVKAAIKADIEKANKK